MLLMPVAVTVTLSEPVEAAVTAPAVSPRLRGRGAEDRTAVAKSGRRNTKWQAAPLRPSHVDLVVVEVIAVMPAPRRRRVLLMLKEPMIVMVIKTELRVALAGQVSEVVEAKKVC